MELAIYAPWILIGLGLLVGIISLRKKFAKRKLKSLFKWPPSP